MPSFVLLNQNTTIINVTLLKTLKETVVLDINTSKKLNTIVLWQVFMVTGSNIICWLPASCTFLTSLFLSNYPIDLLLWNRIIIMPVNSMINPIVFLWVFLRTQIRGKHLIDKGTKVTISTDNTKTAYL